MIAATEPVPRSADAKLLAVDVNGSISHHSRAALPQLLRAGDLLVANDAATLPASLFGSHDRTRNRIEVRLAGHEGLPQEALRFLAVIFGDGDYHQRTEDRSAPPQLRAGDRLTLGPLHATIGRLLDHPRLALLEFDGSAAAFWTGLARHGRPIQYSHVPAPLALWDTWTAVAATPVAFEPPSAGFILSWELLNGLRGRGVNIATLTHAAGISSTGDPELDARLPFDEPYFIPPRTVALIAATRQAGGRVIAIGTTVVRALEDAAHDGQMEAGAGVATLRVGADTHLSLVDAVITGTHEAGTSHHELLRAFLDDDVMDEVDAQLDGGGYRTHEFGDSVFIERHLRCSTRFLPPAAVENAATVFTPGA